MSKVPIIISYNGRWDENNSYVDNQLLPLLVDENINYDMLLELLYIELRLNRAYSLKLLVNLSLSSSLNNSLELQKDKDIEWFITILKNNNDMPSSFPLIVIQNLEPIRADVSHSTNQSSSNSYGNVFGVPENRFKIEWLNSSSSIAINSEDSVSCSSSSKVMEFVDIGKLPQHGDIKVGLMFNNKEEVQKTLYEEKFSVSSCEV